MQPMFLVVGRFGLTITKCHLLRLDAKHTSDRDVCVETRIVLFNLIDIEFADFWNLKTILRPVHLHLWILKQQATPGAKLRTMK